MTLEVKRKEKETAQSLIHRFTKAIQQSGILIRTRKSRFRKRSPSHQTKKRSALRREELKKQYQKLKKAGKSENYKS